MCKCQAESCNHLLLQCSAVYELCCSILRLCGVCWVMAGSVCEELGACRGVGRGRNKGINLIPVTFFWIVWKDRNARIFERKETDITKIRDR